MLLLDENLPLGLSGLLRKLGQECDTTQARGWRELSNGMLVEAASKAGFTAIITKDGLFSESASRALKNYPNMSVVLLKLPQLKEALYLQKFEEEWKRSPIVLRPGELFEWPSIV